ncbi:MAG: HEAT repeat domain-containing protein [Microcystis novacekii Mn_MB_F_20050700_S1]|uniref:HEAT repeat domain-containing protein n=1 Tax=Microcystis novacekii Mn_MB_F_20050700_S1D TaxID=2486266 RepID=A0A552J020_9CHRO|nr:MAG: HEAT repeat domain-containing protein [Microcystis novacekii Mn_MB_F_20050700_S1]TRU89022.1 MAG: HEAT repeat domain-containing protein [Microcystis novacekii Mn_MB_F_20050700_S1D]
MQALLEKAQIALNKKDWKTLNASIQRLLNQKDAVESIINDEILDLALEALQKCDFPQRWEIAKLFPQIGQSAIAPLIALLESEEQDGEMRWFLARILSQFDDRACILALSQLLQRSEEEELSQMAAAALANIGSSAISSLEQLLSDSNTRFLAVQALSQIRRPEIIEPLLTVVKDQSSAIRAMAIEALSSFRDPQITAIILDALQDPAIDVRREAIKASIYLLPNYPQADLVRHLQPLLFDIHLDICQETAIALGRIGTAASAKALNPLLQSSLTPDSLKLTVVRALGWIEDGEALNYLEKALYSENILICREIIAILGRQTSQKLRRQAGAILGNFYHSCLTILGDTGVKQSLAIALGALDRDNKGILLTLATDGEAIVRLHALSALKKLDQATI